MSTKIKLSPDATDKQMFAGICSMTGQQRIDLIQRVMVIMYGRIVGYKDDGHNWSADTLNEIANAIGEAGLLPSRLNERFTRMGRVRK